MNNNNNLTEQLLNSNDNSNSTPEELKIINYCLLTPIEKWKKFRKFPTKLLLHVILLISITVQIVFWSEQSAGRQATSNVYNAVRKLVLHKEEYDLEAISTEKQKEVLCTKDELYSELQSLITGYNKMSKDGLECLTLKPMTLKYYYRGDLSIPYLEDQSEINIKTYANVNENNDDDDNINNIIGPFDTKNYNSTLQRNILKKMIKTEITFLMELETFIDECRTCVIYEVLIDLDFKFRTCIRVGERVKALKMCAKDTMRNVFDTCLAGYAWNNIINVICCLIAIPLCLRSIRRRLLYVRKLLRKSSSRSNSNKSGINFYCNSIKFINWYLITFLIGHVCILYRSCIDLYGSYSARLTEKFEEKAILSVGHFCLWFSAVRYGSHDFELGLLLHVLNRALFVAGKFIIGTLPILIGYALIGFILFSNTSMFFESISKTFITLFGLACGDSVVDVFFDIQLENPYLGPFYLYTYVPIAIFVILNIFLVIVQQTYIEYRREYGLDQKRGSNIHNKRSGSNNDDDGTTRRKSFIEMIDVNNVDDDDNNNDDNDDGKDKDDGNNKQTGYKARTRRGLTESNPGTGYNDKDDGNNKQTGYPGTGYNAHRSRSKSADTIRTFHRSSRLDPGNHAIRLLNEARENGTNEEEQFILQLLNNPGRFRLSYAYNY